MPTPSGHTRAINAKRVIGTDIRDPAGSKIGHVEDIMLDKLSNEIMFAVAGFGGVMGMGEKYHPIPWHVLEYDQDEECYRCSLTEDQLKSAPSDSIEALTRNDGRDYRDLSDRHFGSAPTTTY